MATGNGAAGDDDAGKMFIGGVSRDTTEQSLRSYFEQYGHVKDCILMTDKATGNSRGFGFVTFSNPSSVEDVMNACPHTLDNKRIDPKKCTPRHMQQKKTYSNQYSRSHKIFVGGLSMEATEEDVKTYFSKYGVITEVVFVSDKNDPSRPHKGFGFVTFEDESSVDQAIAKHYHVIKDKRCEAKSAESKDKLNQMKQAGPGGYNNQNKMMGYDQNKMGPYGPQGMAGMGGGYGGQGGMNNMSGYNAPPGQGPYVPGNGQMGGYNGGYNNPSFPTAYPQQYNNPCGYNNQGYPNHNYGYGYNQMGHQGMNMPNTGGGAVNPSMGGGAMTGNDMSGNQGYGMNNQQPTGGYNASAAGGSMARGDMGGTAYQQHSSAYGPMRSDYSAGSTTGAAGTAQPSTAPNTMPQNGNYTQNKTSAGGGYHPYRRT